MNDIVKKIDNSEKYVIFTVGDSITEGIGLKNDEDTYTAALARGIAEIYPERSVQRYDGKRFLTHNAELLPIEHFDGPFTVSTGGEKSITVVRCGVGGNTVKRLLDRRSDFIGKMLEGKSADLFLICVGINDSLKEDAEKYVTEKQYGDNLNCLISEIKAAMPNADIILMTPTYNDAGLSLESSLDAYANEMIAIAKKHELPVIDLHKMWVEHTVIGGNNYGQGEWLSGRKGDCCHPSAKGHAAIASEILRCIWN